MGVMLNGFSLKPKYGQYMELPLGCSFGCRLRSSTPLRHSAENIKPFEHFHCPGELIVILQLIGSRICWRRFFQSFVRFLDCVRRFRLCRGLCFLRPLEMVQQIFFPEFRFGVIVFSLGSGTGFFGEVTLGQLWDIILIHLTQHAGEMLYLRGLQRGMNK